MEHDNPECLSRARQAFRWCATMFVAIVAGSVSPSVGFGETYDRHIAKVEVGFDGYYGVGRWSPIRVHFHPPAGDNWQLVVTVPDPDGHPTRIELPAGNDVRSPELEEGVISDLTLRAGLFRMGRLHQPIQVQLVDSGEVVDSFTVAADDASANRPLTTSSSLWLLVGQTEIFGAVPAWLEERAADAAKLPSRDVVLVHRDDPSALPDFVDAYDSVELVVISDNLALTESQSLALRQWIERGGRLVVSIGSRLAEYQASPIAEWSRVNAARARTITSLGPLTTLVATTSGINLFYTIVGADLSAEGVQVLAEGSEGPLVVRAAIGLGTVTATSFDLDLDVVLQWESAPELALALADMTDIATQRDAEAVDAAGAIGAAHSELQSQLVTVVDQYPDVVPISNFSVLSLLSVYLLAIGVLDYLLVHRWIKRPQLTWVTLPVWLTFGILLTSAYGLSHSSAVDAARRVELIDVVADTGQVRVHDWLALYSATTKRQSIRESVASAWAGESDVLLSWAGRPESSFRGMFRQSGLSFGDPEYAYDDKTLGFADFPRLPNASRVLEGEAWLNTSGLVESSLRDNGRGELLGSFTHHLPLPITDWFIAYRNSAYYPKQDMYIEPGAPFFPDEHLHPVIKSYLTGVGAQRTSADPSRHHSGFARSAYDPSADGGIDYVMRMVSFHDAAGGTGYTSLDNQYLERLELSRLLDLRQAVVFGRLDDSVVSLELDGKPVEVAADTYVRLVLPVAAP